MVGNESLSFFFRVQHSLHKMMVCFGTMEHYAIIFIYMRIQLFTDFLKLLCYGFTESVGKKFIRGSGDRQFFRKNGRTLLV
jgi:hypothetical protein